MNDKRLPGFLYLASVIAAILRCAYVYPQLPDVMASHFNAYGVPNGWQPKNTFFILIAAVIVIPAVLAFIVPRRFPSMPPDKINLPNKSYWLAPERREETWRFFSAQMAWFGCALLFLLLYAMSQAIDANLPSVGQLNWPGMCFALGAFMLFIVVWVVHLLRHFSRVPESQSQSSSS
jgi:uncharacterized membrane protein